MTENQSNKIIITPRKCKCSKCHGPIRINTKPIKCLNEGCENRYHQNCTDLNKDNVIKYYNGEINWICVPCTKKQQSTDHLTQHQTNDLPEATKNNLEATDERKSLRVLQWNAEGINPKMYELRERAKSDDLDVIMVQESQLNAKQETPAIPNYTPFRVDRKGKSKGGLISFVKNSLIYERVVDRCKDATETSTFSIKLNRNKWVKLTNVYCPPSTSLAFANQNLRLATEIIPSDSNSIIAGDFNAHSFVWDHTNTAQDERGETVLDWMIDDGLTILNDGTPTRVNKSTGEESTPDVTLAGEKWMGKTTWTVMKPIGSSDHLPILIEISTDVKHVAASFGAKWKSKDVDWDSFSNAIETGINEIDQDSDDIKTLVTDFNKVVIEAAEKHVGKVKPGKRPKGWMTPTVRAAIRKRNALRRNIKTQRREWIESCKEARQEILRAKEESWKEFLDESVNSTDESQLWKVIKSLNGTPSTNSKNEVLKINGKKLTLPQAKADAFVDYYSDISKLKLSKDDREFNRLVKKRLENAPDQEVPDFTMGELKRAIKKMKKKGAPGPDNIPPSFLKNLGEQAMKHLLKILNHSLQNSACPQIWRNAIIVPLLKAGKPASEIASFRPISLTSCIVKVLERMIGERLYYLAESKGWFSALQAGFRKKRSCEDQILKIIQTIEDGFHNRPKGKKSVLVLLDFSKAYDTVWRLKLLDTLLDKGVPTIYVRWLFAFLQNRQARVRYDGVLGKSKNIHQGLPQGSVLAPILFVFYINNLAEILPGINIYALFADDVSILAQGLTKEEAVAKAQIAVDIVVKWSIEWKLNLNALKSESSFFSTSNASEDTKFVPQIIIDGKSIEFKPSPRLLGVWLDRTLCMSKHVDVVVEKVRKKLRMLAAISNSEWGWKKFDLKKIFTAHILSIFEYSGSAWQTWLSESQLLRLERVQRQALRIITCQSKTSPEDCMRLEIGVPSIRSLIKSTVMKSHEKALRLPQDHPRRICLDQEPIVRLQRRTNCRTTGYHLREDLPPETVNRRSFSFYSIPPWLQGLGTVEIFKDLPGITSKHDDPEKIKEAAINRINALNTDLKIYTDGSAESGMFFGGAAAVITRGPAEAPVMIGCPIKIKGSYFTCSYSEEWLAMEGAISWMENHYASPVTIITDSQSLCEALLGTGTELDELRYRLRNWAHGLYIQWVPGHCGVPGNEMADKAAKEAAELEGPYQPIHYSSICCRINTISKDPPSKHLRTRKVYSNFSKSREILINNRSDQSLLAKIRTGKTTLFKAYKNEIDRNCDPMCPLCQDELHTLEHWFTECPGTLERRRDLFGLEDFDKLESLTKHPTEVVSLAKSTLLGEEE